jgi:hypothetical protein
MVSSVEIQSPGFRPTESRPMSRVRGERPAATRSSSASTGTPLVSIRTRPSDRVTRVVSVPSSRVTPRSRNASPTSSPANGSMPASRPLRTIMVTAVPKPE